MTRFRRRTLRRIRYVFRRPGAPSPVERWAEVVETRIDRHARPVRARQRRVVDQCVDQWVPLFKPAEAA